VARVIGVGGVFFRARDPAALAEWYQRVLGLSFEGDDSMYAVLPDAGDGYAVFALFPPKSEYIGDPATQPAMANLRVDDLDGVLTQLRAAGATTEGPTDEGYGRFAWFIDPEGRRVELWEMSSEG
jgi:predicted enzyme related to lactoylglutathione lyase